MSEDRVTVLPQEAFEEFCREIARPGRRVEGLALAAFLRDYLPAPKLAPPPPVVYAKPWKPEYPGQEPPF